MKLPQHPPSGSEQSTPSSADYRRRSRCIDHRRHHRDWCRRRGTRSQPRGSLRTTTSCRSPSQHRKMSILPGPDRVLRARSEQGRTAETADEGPSHRGRATARERLETSQLPRVDQLLPAVVPDLATTLYLLNELLHKGIKFVWSSDCQAAFQKVKNLIASDQVLIMAHYDPNLRTGSSRQRRLTVWHQRGPLTRPHKWRGSTHRIRIAYLDQGRARVLPDRQGSSCHRLGCQTLQPLPLRTTLRARHGQPPDCKGMQSSCLVTVTLLFTGIQQTTLMLTACHYYGLSAWNPPQPTYAPSTLFTSVSWRLYTRHGAAHQDGDTQQPRSLRGPQPRSSWMVGRRSHERPATTLRRTSERTDSARWLHPLGKSSRRPVKAVSNAPPRSLRRSSRNGTY